MFFLADDAVSHPTQQPLGVSNWSRQPRLMLLGEDDSNITEDFETASDASTTSRSDFTDTETQGVHLVVSPSMASNQPISLVTSKAGGAPPQLPSPSQVHIPTLSSHDSYSQRRNGGSGSHGTGASTRTTISAARNNQSLRKQNKAQRRPRLGDEDMAAESVSKPYPDSDSTFMASNHQASLDGSTIDK